MSTKLVTVALPATLVRQLSRALHQEQNAPAASRASAALVGVERPRVGYSIKGKVARSKLTPRAIQVLDYLQAHPKAPSHDIEKFLVSKADVPVDSVANSFRGAMARLRAAGVVRSEPLSMAADSAPRRKRSRKH